MSRISVGKGLNNLIIARPFANVATATNTTTIADEWAAAKSYQEIPGPAPLPIIGNAFRFVTGEFDFSNLIKAQNQLRATYGDIVRFSGLPKRNDLLFIFNPDDISKLYYNMGQWPERPSLRSLKYYRTVVRKDFFKGFSGVLNDQGPAWQEARSQVNPILMQTKTVQLYAERINDVAEDFIKRIPEWSDENKQMPDDFANELHKWALESIAVIALDTRLGCLEPNLPPDSEPQRMINAVHDTFKSMHKLEFGPGIWQFVSTPLLKKFIKTMDYFNDVCMKYITPVVERVKQNKVDEDKPSVLERFLQRDPNSIRAVVMALDMLLAGVDTTSYAVMNMLLHMSKNQDIQAKLFEELKSIIPDPYMKITPEMLNEMKYLRACIRETHRMTPVATGNVRTTQSEIVLSNYQVPKKVDILIGNGSISLLNKHFPDADKFKPERWIRNQQVTTPNPFVSLPFGHGARKCVGMRFANLEMETLLCKLLRRYRWEWHYPDVTYKTLLIHRPVDPLKYTVIPRK